MLALDLLLVAHTLKSAPPIEACVLHGRSSCVCENPR